MKSLTPEPPSPDARPIMDRRKFVTAVAALGATAALPARAAEMNPPAGGTADSADALRLAMLRNETTRQLTTFNLRRKSKTIPVARGQAGDDRRGQGRGLHRPVLAHVPRLVLATLEHQGRHQPVHPQDPHPADLLGRRRAAGGRRAGGRLLRRGLVRGGQLRLTLFRHLQRRLLLQVADAVPEELPRGTGERGCRTSTPTSSATSCTS